MAAASLKGNSLVERMKRFAERTWWWPVAILFLGQFMSGAIGGPQSSLFPVYLERDLGFAALAISLSSSVRQLLGMAASLIGGALCDSLGRRQTFVLGLSGIIAGSLIFQIQWPWLVVLIWAYAGFSLGLRTVGGMGYLIDVARPEMLGTLSAIYTWGQTLGGAVGNAVAGPVVDQTSFAHFGRLMFVVSAVVVGFVWLALPKPAATTAAVKTQARKGLFGYGDLLKRADVVALGMLRFLPTSYWGVASVFIPLWIYDQTESVSMVAWYGTLSQVMASLAQWVVGRLSDRIGRRRPALVVLSILLISIIALALTGQHLWGIYAFGTLGACAAWCMSALIPGLASDVADAQERGRVLGLLHLLWNGGMLVGALIGGALFEWSAAAPFWVAAGFGIGALVYGFRLFRLLQQRQPAATPAS